MSEAESKPAKKTKAVKPVTMPEVTIPAAQVPKPKSNVKTIQGAKVLEIQGVGCVVNLEGSSVFVPGVRVLGDNLVAAKR